MKCYRECPLFGVVETLWRDKKWINTNTCSFYRDKECALQVFMVFIDGVDNFDAPATPYEGD
jgi:hypothetical protein